MEHTEQYRGLTIRIKHDDNPSNPYDDNEGMYPMIVRGGRNFGDHDYYDLNDTLTGQLHGMNYGQLAGVLLKLDNGKEMIHEARQHAMDEVGDSLSVDDPEQDIQDHAVEHMIDAIRDNADDPDTLEAIADSLGWPCLNTYTRGYSQGDHLDLFVCWTPEFHKRTGLDAKGATKESLEANAKEYGAWAWGNAYGYVIEENGEEVGSCWGYLEPDPWPIEKTYVIQEAKAAADAHIEHRRRKHWQQVKTWIRNRVPFMHRKPLVLTA